ncbi:MAG TPA: rRNA maturation RNase YbeY, partial [Candidatus Kapabacteria bacterium]|nr:rRNA maturation RNase YbeY [Candidatus Kapabacteria bacterium]
MRYTFRLSQTSGARKSFQITKELKAAIKAAGKAVASQEIADLASFELSIVTMTDEELRELNVQSLEHDYYTDILTFEIDRTARTLLAELYLSVDRARENAQRHKQSTEDELILLTIHGVLHLAGYDDHDPAAKRKMHRRQSVYL